MSSIEYYEKKLNKKHQFYTISIVFDRDGVFKNGKYIISCGGCSRLARFKTDDFNEISAFITACEVLIDKNEEMLEKGQTDLSKYLIDKDFILCQS